jgi:hypothetical protein
VQAAACRIQLKCCFCNVPDALHEKLEDIAWVEEQPWEESLAITAAQATHVADVDDDLDRELAFYNQVGVQLIWPGYCWHYSGTASPEQWRGLQVAAVSQTCPTHGCR